MTGVGVAIDRGEGEASALQIAERRAVERGAIRGERVDDVSGSGER